MEQTEEEEKTEKRQITLYTYPAVRAGNHGISHPRAKAGSRGPHSDGVANSSQTTTSC